jgi:hypothetical protein
MIKLDRNYQIKINNSHGFELIYTSDPVKKKVKTKDGTVVKDISQTETWYFPKLSQVLEKYYTENLLTEADMKLIEKVIKIEMNIDNFSKVFANKGELLIL